MNQAFKKYYMKPKFIDQFCWKLFKYLLSKVHKQMISIDALVHALPVTCHKIVENKFYLCLIMSTPLLSRKRSAPAKFILLIIR